MREKSTGLNNLLYEIGIEANNQAVQKFRYIISCVHKTGSIFKHWQHGETITFYKGKKVQKEHVQDYLIEQISEHFPLNRWDIWLAGIMHAFRQLREDLIKNCKMSSKISEQDVIPKFKIDRYKDKRKLLETQKEHF